MDARKPATHSPDHRDDHFDPISGPWFEVLDAGDPVPDDPDAVEDEDYIYLQNGAIQPPPGSGPNGGDLELFSFRRGLSRLDTTGHLDVSAFASGDVAFTIPAAYRLSKDKFFTTVVYDGADPIAAMVYFESTTGDVTITFPLT